MGIVMLESVIISLTAGIATYYFYYKIFVCKRPVVHTSNKKLKAILEKVETLKEKYNPPILFFGGQLQTVLSLSQRRMKNIDFQRELIDLKDGGAIALDFLGDKNKNDRPLLIFIPGLTSSSQTPYVKTLVAAFFKSCDVIVVNYRGTAGVPFKTARTYSGSNTEDMKEAIVHIRAKYEGRTLVIAGTSLGGMVLSKYLTTEKNIPFKYALLICIAWDCEMGSQSLEKPFFNRYVINRGLTQGLIKVSGKIGKTVEKLPDIFNMDNIRKCKTVRDFDRLVTAPQFGFKSDLEYYECNSTRDVSKFPIPVIAINAIDDPMQPEHLLPVKESEAEGSNLALITTSHGGHLGFLEGIGKKSVHYLERVCGDIMVEVSKDLQ